VSNYSDGFYDTPNGRIHMSNPGPKADLPYENVETYHQPVTGNTITLQRPALKAFVAAELAQTPRWLRRKGKVRPIRITGHGYRSYAYQKALYDSDSSGRYANPDGSNHVEALAVDLDTSSRTFDRAKKALINHGFKFTVGGEIWHGSYWVEG
jgi:hypothetical protein